MVKNAVLRLNVWRENENKIGKFHTEKVEFCSVSDKFLKDILQKFSIYFLSDIITQNIYPGIIFIDKEMFYHR